jgi:hypothetical protein
MRALFAGLAAVLLVIVAALAVQIGTSLDGHAAVSSQCAMSSDVPKVGGPYVESATVQGFATYFPLGVVCSYDAPRDLVGPQSVIHQNWLMTGVAVLAGLGGLTLLAVTVMLGASSLRKATNAISPARISSRRGY